MHGHGMLFFSAPEGMGYLQIGCTPAFPLS
jgi:hypothetical protein